MAINRCSFLAHATCLFLAVFHNVVSAQDIGEKFDAWPLETSINGTLVLATSPEDLTILKQVLRPLPEDAIVRLYAHDSTATEAITQLESASEPLKLQRTTWQSPDVHAATLEELTKECDVLYWHTTAISTDADRQAIVDCRDILKRFVGRGGLLVLIGPVAQLAGQLNATPGRGYVQGLNLAPDAVIMHDFRSTTEQRSELLKTLELNPRTVGIGLQPNAIMILNGRTVRMIGKGTATFLLPNGEHHTESQQVLAEATSPRQPQKEYMLDWTQWRRRSIDRTLDAFPPKKQEVPYVENGTLVIVGGGGMPDGLMDRIIELAGGPDSAKMVYVPCVEEASISPIQRTVSSWKKGGVRQADFIHTKDRTKANADEQFLKPLTDATGLWFGGGRQWNFSDSYYGTKAHQMMKDVLKRGGVIAGSSAGASIQAEYLARATPIENFDIMAAGYERGGLGFIVGVAIDQHFSQRGRQKDMAKLVDCYPQLLGIGLDEATAIIVQKSTAEIVGRGKVFFYDRSQTAADDVDYVALPAGSSYNLATRTVLIDTTVVQPEERVNAEK